MLKFPMMTTTVLSPLLQVSREFFSILEFLNGGMPSCFEAGKEGTVFGGMAVLRPKPVMVGYTSVVIRKGVKIWRTRLDGSQGTRTHQWLDLGAVRGYLVLVR